MRVLIAAAIVALLAVPVGAGTLMVSSCVLIERHVAAADGGARVMLVRADRGASGDRVTVAVDYRNIGRTPIVGLVLANPVPAGLVYRGPALGSPAPEVSADGHTFAAAPPAGVEPAQVTVVRWRRAAPLAPGGGGRFAFAAMLK